MAAVEARAAEAKPRRFQGLVPQFLRRDRARSALEQAEKIKIGEFREIPDRAFTAEGIARLIVWTERVERGYETRLSLYEPDPILAPTPVARFLTEVGSMEEAVIRRGEILGEHYQFLGEPVSTGKDDLNNPRYQYNQRFLQAIKDPSVPQKS